MRNFQSLAMVAICLTLVMCAAHGQSSSAPIGIFESHGDVGTVLHPGSVEYDDAKRSYSISGSGENMWFSADAFQFVWKKVSGDVTLSADISFLTKTGNEHKKAALILRQSLDADSVYVDVALHASGLTSLQYRDEKGAVTREIRSNLSAPRRLRIAKRGDYVYMSLAADGGEPSVAGGWLRIPLRGEFYAGIGVCSHDKDVIEKAVFSNVELKEGTPAASGQPILYSTLETVAIDSADRGVVYLSPSHFEAPNWTRDGKAILFNRDGHIERLALDPDKDGDKPAIIDTGIATRCNNDHGISPDGTQLAISDNSQEDHNSLVYLVPIAGGTPRRMTQKSPSYWHGWSPDGKTLAFVGQRNGDFDIYTVPVSGGDETRLTTAKGLDDGPEYSPDGKYIYFNSERTGHMQIWRMKADGSEQEQVFSDDLNNWFPHISPDGKWMVFLTYDADVTGHPGNKDVMLRLMSLADKKITVLAKLFGGQGTINVPSWSPDSKQVAFVSYALVPDEKTTAARPTWPTRDPGTSGYVTAKDLPDGANAPSNADGNFILGPTHNPAPESNVQPGVPQGTIYTFSMNSADSKIYPGIARDPGTFGTPDPSDPAKLIITTSHPAPYTRRVAVYVPKQYVPGTAAPFIVGADGPDSLLFTVLDNLIAEHRVPVMIAISIGNGSGDAQGSERGLEYDTMSGLYAEFVEKEVLPQVEKQANVKLTRDPDGRATMGGSSGGSCALIMAWYHPDLYHRVLTYSGTYVNQQWPSNPQTPHGAWQFHEHLIPNTPAKPLRIWMEVGDRDLFNPNIMHDNMHDWVLANENMARALAGKGYHYQFVFARNAGHVDHAVRQQTLPEALEYLWHGYPSAGSM